MYNISQGTVDVGAVNQATSDYNTVDDCDILSWLSELFATEDRACAR